ncbi:D-methionine transport system substrate-binding protein [Propionispira arboris]|uniref:Lipoprotein n=2 Tax=Propionispira arboris TaxID=84035 RepID=A0A1H6ZR21_9FIRM|nr:MetQ/NlpA family ABC transporter substrate-binding protein [Propionispira arboris]SEJ55943.1 D-methionine transport system substrate-binding protein [Propionispira arboris]
MSKISNKGLFAVLMVFNMLVFSGCGIDASKNSESEKSAITIGVTPGPHAEIMEEVKKVAAKEGLDIKIVEFSDYIQPNVALSNGEIDANSYQHQPFLDSQIADRGYKIESIAKTVIFPMAVYSKKLKSLSDIPDGAIVSIPNDPTNGGRALLILEKAGLLKLKENAGLSATVADIMENPQHLQIKELEAAQVALSLMDVDFAVINTNYATQAGLVPNRDALFIEDGKSPYANILVVRSEDKDKAVFKKLIKAYQSDEVKQFITDHFQGSGTAAW